MHPDNDPLKIFIGRQLNDILEKVPADRLAAFKKELGNYVEVGSCVGNKLMINWATTGRTDESVIVLKVLDFLTKELALQLTAHPENNPTADTVLHEKGVRHDPFLCRHCTALR